MVAAETTTALKAAADDPETLTMILEALAVSEAVAYTLSVFSNAWVAFTPGKQATIALIIEAESTTSLKTADTTTVLEAAAGLETCRKCLNERHCLCD